MSEIEVEKPSFTFWQITGLAAVLVTNTFGLGILYNKMSSTTEESAQSIVSLTSDVKLIRDKFPELEFRNAQTVAQSVENKAAVYEQGKRIDRVVESFADKLDKTNEALNKVVTKIEVLSSQLNKNEQNK